jgi:hypothetical protein
MLILSVALTGGPHGPRPPRLRRVEVADDWLTLELADGRHLRMPTVWSPALADAAPAERRGWRLVAGGLGVAWPTLGEILSLHAVPIRRHSVGQSATVLQLPKAAG